jgi:hypothetical protein
VQWKKMGVWGRTEISMTKVNQFDTEI